MNSKNITVIFTLIQILSSPIRYAKFIQQYYNFKKASKKNNRFDISWWHQYPFLFDASENTEFDHHYIYHPAWAARIVKKINSLNQLFSSFQSLSYPILKGYETLEPIAVKVARWVP